MQYRRSSKQRKEISEILKKRNFVGHVCIDTVVSAATAGIWNATGAKEAVKEGSREAAKKVVGKVGTRGVAKYILEKGLEQAASKAVKLS